MSIPILVVRSRVVETGLVVITTGAKSELNPDDVLLALGRHIEGDWGLVCEADWAENQLSLKEGFQILSAYRDRNSTKFWIITEADRSMTTILLPSEY